MSYTALYRKFRPQSFDEVKGQDHIVTTLRNQMKADRIGHAYLFCGTRGTGKTTMAKIFAKAVNCEHPVDGNPCGVCPVCQAIASGSSMNMIEIDAASNNGVEDIRQIREEVSYRPTEGKYKVYIIDEVHMLSVAAFNALLKTLEEPPSYVIFILATTEAHRIPITILSRCQRYDFKRISIDTIAARLAELMEAEGIEAEEKAVRYVAKIGDGSMRDALSLLDQCISFYLGQKLTYDNVLTVLGAVDTEVFSKLLTYIREENVTGAIATLDGLVTEGRELGQFVNDFTWYLRNLLLLQESDDMEDVLDISGENLAELKQMAQSVEAEILIRYIYIFSELGNRIRYATQKRILVEIALIKLCKPQMQKDALSYENRIINLEKKMENGVVVAAGSTGAVQSAQSAAAKEPPKLTRAIPEEVKQVIASWNSVLAECGAVSGRYLKSSGVLPTLGPQGELMLVVSDENAYEYLSENKADCVTELKQKIAARFQKEVEILIRKNESSQPADEVYPDLRKLIDFDIKVEE